MNQITKNRIYNFCLNSNFGGNTPATSSTFFVDWSVLSEGEYKVSFTFTSAVTTTDFIVKNIYSDITISTIYTDFIVKNTDSDITISSETTFNANINASSIHTDFIYNNANAFFNNEYYIY